MDAVSLERSNYLVDDILGKFRTDIKVLQFGVMTPRATDGAAGHENRCPDARPVSQVVIDDSSYFHWRDTSTPFVCLVRRWTSACLPALKARR